MFIFRFTTLFWVATGTGLLTLVLKKLLSCLILPSAAAQYSPSEWNALF